MINLGVKDSFLGSSNLKISRIILGNAFSNPRSSSRVFSQALDFGVNTFDTSCNYKNGEYLLGRNLRKVQRDKVIVCTKFSSEIETKLTLSSNIRDENDKGWSRKLIYNSVHNSLKQLGTDYIDVLQVHHPFYSSGHSAKEMIITLDQLMTQGKIRYCGLSNMIPGQIINLSKLARLLLGPKGKELFYLISYTPALYLKFLP